MRLFTSGVDFSVLPCIGKSDVTNGIQNMVPYIVNGLGMVIASDSAPDVITNPYLKNFIWLKTIGTVKTGEFYYYNDSSWTLLSIVNGSLLADNSVPLAKLSGTGAAALNIIQRNAANNGWQLVSVVNAITNGTIPLTKLVGGDAGNTILCSLAGSNFFLSPGVVAGLFPGGAFLLAQLEAGSAVANQVMVSLAGINQYIDISQILAYIGNNVIPIDSLKVETGTALQVIQVNASANGFQFYTLPPPPNFITSLTPQALPAAAGDINIAHGLTRAPSYLRAVFVCTADDAGFVVGDEIESYSVYLWDGADDQTPVLLIVNATNVKATFTANVLTSPYGGPMDRTKYTMKFYISY